MDYRYWYTFLYNCPNCKQPIRVGFVVIGKDLNSFYLCDSNVADKDLEIAKANNINLDICPICGFKLDTHDIYDKHTCEIAFYSDEELKNIKKQSYLIERVKPM